MSIRVPYDSGAFNLDKTVTNTTLMNEMVGTRAKRELDTGPFMKHALYMYDVGSSAKNRNNYTNLDIIASGACTCIIITYICIVVPSL